MTFAEFVRTKREIGAVDLGNLLQSDEFGKTPDANFFVYVDKLYVEILGGGNFRVLENGKEWFADTPEQLMIIEELLYQVALEENIVENTFIPKIPDAELVKCLQSGHGFSREEAKGEAQIMLLDTSLLKVRSQGSVEERLEWLLDRIHDMIICDCEDSIQCRRNQLMFHQVSRNAGRCLN